MISLVTKSDFESTVRTELTRLADSHYGPRKYCQINLEKIIQFVIQSESNLEFSFLDNILNIGYESIYCYGISCVSIPIFGVRTYWEFHNSEADIVFYCSNQNKSKQMNYSDLDIWKKIQEILNDIADTRT